jgi:hypothetical protein
MALDEREPEGGRTPLAALMLRRMSSTRVIPSPEGARAAKPLSGHRHIAIVSAGRFARPMCGQIASDMGDCRRFVAGFASARKVIQIPRPWGQRTGHRRRIGEYHGE